MFIPDEFLLRAAKPARYIGNEINMAVKDAREARIRFAFCFPDVYEVGMSHLGLSILYYFMNERADTYCERAFAPWHDMEQIMRENGFPLFALETGDPLSAFDFVGFTLQYEMCCTNVLNMLDLAGIPIHARDRGDKDPIVCAGGPCCYNPEPYADFFDFFYIGEGEAVLNDILDMYAKQKASGAYDRRGFLESLLSIEGVYVPRFYDAAYNQNNELSSFKPNNPSAPETIRKVFVKDLDDAFFPEKELIPFIETIHDRTALELFRGCIRGCRFCQAGFTSRPVREKTAGKLISQAESLIANSGHEEISLVSLSTSDYSEFNELAHGLLDRFQKAGVNLSLPSLRLDAFSVELMDNVHGARKPSVTFAPEAGTQRLRDVINKGFTEDDILNGLRLAFAAGYSKLKLYVMCGLPTETYEDLDGIADLIDKIIKVFYERDKTQRKGGVTLHVSLACFVPKPFTPFQFAAQDSAEVFKDKQIYLKKLLKKKGVKLSYHHPEVSVIEAFLARGDRRASAVIYNAWKLGARFDGWSEFFNHEIWTRAFSESGVDPAFYAQRERSYDELLPWAHIDCGVEKQYLVNECEKAIRRETTSNCRRACNACGIQKWIGGVCFEQ